MSTKFSNNVETLRRHHFAYFDIRQLVLLPSIRYVNTFAFYGCKRLAFTDICRRCLAQTGLEEVAVPSSVKYIGRLAFGMNGSLREVRFLGATEGE